MMKTELADMEIPALDEKRPGKNARWGQERRLEFIDFRLLWEGRINRGEISEFFGISIQQASLDLALYMGLAPNNIEYDRSDKVYRATGSFRPVLTSADAQSFLKQLLGVANESLPTTQSFIGWRPPCDIVRFPTRAIDPRLFIKVIWAIRDRQDLLLTYQSMRRPTATNRWVAPHAIGFDGARWHVRAWCHENADFRDFVFSRIQHVHDSRASAIDISTDHQWHTYATLTLRPNQEFTQHQREAVATDFGMKDGVLEVSVREALVFYFVRQLQLDRHDQEAVKTRQIEWVNEAELKHLVEAAQK